MSDTFQLLTDSAGLIVQAARSNILSPGAIQVSEEVYHSAVPGRDSYLSGELVPAPPTAPSLASIKEQLKAQVDAAAEAARLKYITPGTGQAMEYQAVYEEALRLQSDASPNPAAYPNLTATIGIDRDPATGAVAASVQDVAGGVLFMQTQWAAVGAAIRNKRLGAKAAIEAATDEAAARAVVAAIVWP